PAPVVLRDPRAGQRRPDVLLAPGEVLDGDPPQLALEHRRAAVGIGRHRKHAPLHPQAPSPPPADGPDDDRPAAGDLAADPAVARALMPASWKALATLPACRTPAA